MKVEELVGAKLDYWVAVANDLSPQLHRAGKYPNGREVYRDYVDAGTGSIYEPSVNWSQGGPIIEREKIKLEPIHKLKGGEFLEWNAKAMPWQYAMEGPTALIAAMRAFVASKFGLEVDDS